MKVVHLITDLDVGGAEVVMARLVGGLDAARSASSVISLSSIGSVGASLAKNNIPVYAIGMDPGRLNGAALWRLIQLLRRLQPDILQTWLYHADFAGVIAGRLAGVGRVVWNIRCAELDPADHPRSLRFLLKILAALSGSPAAIVCNSVAGRREHERLGYHPRRWQIISNGFDTEIFHPDPVARATIRDELGLTDGVPLVGLLARLHPMKDHPTFLRAAALIAQTRSDVQFVAAGRGVDKSADLASLAQALSIQGRVSLLPERNDSPQFLAALDVAVSASYGEAFPNVIGEAMSCGTPCVVTDVGDSRRLVGETGCVVRPRDPAALAAGVVQMLAMDKASRDELGQKARRRIQTDFALGPTVEQYQKMYSEIAAICAE